MSSTCLFISFQFKIANTTFMCKPKKSQSHHHFFGVPSPHSAPTVSALYSSTEGLRVHHREGTETTTYLYQSFGNDTTWTTVSFSHLQSYSWLAGTVHVQNSSIDLQRAPETLHEWHRMTNLWLPWAMESDQ